MNLCQTETINWSLNDVCVQPMWGMLQAFRSIEVICRIGSWGWCV